MKPAKRIITGLLLLLITQSALATPLNINFLLDRSGSVGLEDWNTQIQYLDDVIESLDKIDRNISITSFDTGARTHHLFSDDQSYSTISASLSNISYVGGRTHSKAGLNESLDIFEMSGFNKHNHLIMYTDGNPYPFPTQNVCSDDTLKNRLDDNKVKLSVVSVGNNFSPNKIYGCVVDATDKDIIEALSYDIESLQAINNLVFHRFGGINPRDLTNQSACEDFNGYIWDNNQCYFYDSQFEIPEPTHLMFLSVAVLLFFRRVKI
jgi:hypothetical protein